MAIDPARFAQECVRQGLYFGIAPHYLLGAAKLRSGISDANQGDQIGPFRLKQAEWDANCKNDDFELDYTPDDINSWRAQCAICGLIARHSFDTLVAKNSRNPSALELYLQQWPDAAGATLQADLQKALDDTAALLDPAAQAVLGTAAPTAPPPITDAGRHDPAPAPIPGKFTTLRAANQSRWQQMQIHQDLIGKIDKTAAQLVRPDAKARYQGISAQTRVPWFIIAVIHEREASQDFSKSLAQGDPWNQVSVNEPAGRGPFSSFEEAALDALINCPPKAASWPDWTGGGAMTLLELYNGLGYAKRNLPSPYVWASTNQYVKGKFTRDHHFDPEFVDPQIGCAALLSRMKALDASIQI